jgi:ATP-dependent Clp protease adaptor protein ClpS
MLSYYSTIFYFCLKPGYMNFYREEPGTQLDEDVLLDTAVEQPCQLIVWNDEVNTFEWVIETLMDVCKHTAEQAEQCALLIHTKGKYSVKNGQYEELKPPCDAITERGINATIEVTAD